MHLWAHLQGGEAMGRCPFRATRPGGCRSGDHIHEAVTASPRTRPKRSPQGHGLLPNQQRTDALRPVSEPRSLRRLGSGRSRLQDDHRATTEAVGNALDSQPRQRNYCPSLFPAQWPLGRILGTTRRWLISGRFFTYKFGAHPLRPPRLLLFGANATICCSMSPTDTGQSGACRPRVGIPWRTSAEEEEATISGKRGKTQDYMSAVERAGAEGVLVPLKDEPARNHLIPTLDGFVLPGSPADVAPRQYGSVNRGLSAPADAAREEADRAILQHAFAEKKPVLAICYGCQLLNVYLGGTLIQDLRAETSTATPHRKKDLVPEPQDDPTHPATLVSGSRLATLARGTQAVINSSHHQAIREPGKHLRVTSRASDGTIEGVEWTGDSNWVTGVQWHPERMLGDAFSERLFREFVTAAADAREAVAHKT